MPAALTYDEERRLNARWHLRPFDVAARPPPRALPMMHPTVRSKDAKVLQHASAGHLRQHLSRPTTDSIPAVLMNAAACTAGSSGCSTLTPC